MQQDSHWLNQKRFTVYPRLTAAMQGVAGILWVLLAKQGVDSKGKPLGYDFITFWSASYLALAKHAVDAYTIPLIFKAESVAVPASHSIYVWYYPPPFFLLVFPVALLPYLLSYWVFILSTLACFVFVFRRVTKSHAAMWCLAGFPALWMNLFHGQNAFLTASIAGAALICMRRRPVLAGVFVGLLAIKPHLALLFPVALIAARAWRTMVSAAVTAAIFMGVSTAVLGRDTWRACLASLGNARIFLEGGSLPWAKMPTVFAFLRMLHAPVAVAYAVHAVGAMVAGLCVWYVWRRSEDWQLRGAALMTATFLVSPYVFDYDLVWLAFPIAWLALIGLRDGWMPGDREVLVAAWALTMLMALVTAMLVVQPGPFVIGALLWLAVRRAGRPLHEIGERVHSRELAKEHVASRLVSP
jgi:Glycosyltransferase family 87